MPAKNRAYSENLLDEEENLQQQHRRKQSRRERRQAREIEEEDADQPVDEGEEEEEDSDGIPPEDLPEFFYIDLTEVRKDAQCPICLGIIKKTRTVMECMHRFCRECIDKAMRLGNNECPACRTHCASRRSLRDDPKFDEVIEFFFPNVDKYEEEEVAFFEEERTINKQIQDSIVQIYERQSEALHKRRATAKETATTSTLRLPRSQRKAYSRRRRNSRGSKIQESEGNKDENDQEGNEDENDQDGNKDSSSSDERGPEVQPRRYKRRRGVCHSRPSSSAANTSGGCFENEREQSTERGTSPRSGILWKAGGLTWGRGGARSHTRQGGASGSKDTRTRFCKQLVDHLHGLKEDDDEYVAHQTSLKAENVEMLLVKEPIDLNEEPIDLDEEPIDLNEEPRTINTSAPIDDLNSLSPAVGGSKLVLERLEGQETLVGLKNNFSPSSDNTIIYVHKETKQTNLMSARK